jgi:periplasmic protein CpxP/Spy
MLLSRKSLVFTMVVFLIGSSVAIANPFSNAKTNSSIAWQQPVAQMSSAVKDEGRGKFLEQLNLSNEQRQQIASIRQKYQGQIEQLQERGQTTQEELFEMMAGTESVSDIRAKRDDVVEIRQELGNARFESLLEMREVLTPEQRTQLAQKLERRREGWRNNRSGDRGGRNWF